MRASGLAVVAGSHRNMVKSSLPLASRSGRPPRAASYLRGRCAHAPHCCFHVPRHMRHNKVTFSFALYMLLFFQSLAFE